MQSHNLVGELTIHTAAEQKATLLALLEPGEDLELNAAEITELDTAGLQLLLLLKREGAGAGVQVRLTEPSTAVSDVLAIANVSPELGIADPTDEGSAL